MSGLIGQDSHKFTQNNKCSQIVLKQSEMGTTTSYSVLAIIWILTDYYRFYTVPINYSSRAYGDWLLFFKSLPEVILSNLIPHWWRVSVHFTAMPWSKMQTASLYSSMCQIWYSINNHACTCLC